MSHDSLEQVFNVKSPARLRLSNVSGSVDIQAGDDNKISVLATKQPGTGDVNRTAIECLQAEDGSVAIATRYGENSWSWLLGSNICAIDYVVKVPQQCSLTVNGVSNTLNISGITGDIDLKMVSGDITLHDLEGKLNLDSVSGDLLAENLSGSGSIKTVSGDINLKNADLTSLGINTVSGDVFLQTALLTGPYKFNSVSGDVRLLVPAASQCDIEIHSASGDLSTNIPVSMSSHNHGSQTARMGQGGTQVIMNSVSGDLSVECDGEIPQAPVVNKLDILSRVENGELSVDEALVELNR
jgi:hypothetical protein